MSASVNVKPSAVYPAVALGAPISVAAAGTLSTGWVLADDAWLTLLVLMGAGDGATAVTWEQATDSSGTGAKALDAGDFAAGASACPALLATDDGKVKQGDGRSQYVDQANGFGYVRAKATVTGGTGTLLAMALLKGPARYGI